MIEVAQFLRSETRRKNVESGFNIKLIENNEMIGKLFNTSLLLELNESKEEEEEVNESEEEEEEVNESEEEEEEEI